jgi:hypothetical protein
MQIERAEISTEFLLNPESFLSSFVLGNDDGFWVGAMSAAASTAVTALQVKVRRKDRQSSFLVNVIVLGLDRFRPI